MRPRFAGLITATCAGVAVRRGRFLVTAFAVLIVLGGCSKPSAKASSTSSSTTVDTSSSAAAPSSTISEQLDPERQAIVDAYKGFYNAIYSLKSPTDTDVIAALSPFGEDPIVQHWVKVFQQFAAEGRHPASFVTFGPIDIAVSAGSATLVECRDGTSETMINSADGSIVGQGKPNTKVEATLSRSTDGHWLVRTAGGIEDAC